VAATVAQQSYFIDVYRKAASGWRGRRHGLLAKVAGLIGYASVFSGAVYLLLQQFSYMG
jgi:nitroreductase